MMSSVGNCDSKGGGCASDMSMFEKASATGMNEFEEFHSEHANMTTTGLGLDNKMVMDIAERNEVRETLETHRNRPDEG